MKHQFQALTRRCTICDTGTFHVLTGQHKKPEGPSVCGRCVCVCVCVCGTLATDDCNCLLYCVSWVFNDTCHQRTHTRTIPSRHHLRNLLQQIEREKERKRKRERTRRTRYRSTNITHVFSFFRGLLRHNCTHFSLQRSDACLMCLIQIYLV